MLDALAFDAAYRQYAKSLKRVAERVTHGSADAEDVAQDAWVQAWKGRGDIEAESVWGWLCRVVRRVWWHRVNRVQGRQKAPEMIALDGAPEEVINEPQHTEAQRTQIADAGASLNKANAFAIKAAFAGLDSADVAQARGISLQAATEAMRRAVVMLRKKWRLE